MNRGREDRAGEGGGEWASLVSIKHGEGIDKWEVLCDLVEFVVRNHAVLVLVIDLVHGFHHVVHMLLQSFGVRRLDAGDPIGKNHRLCRR